MNQTITTKKNLSIVLGVLAAMIVVLIGGRATGMLEYLQEVKAATKTHSLSTSMSTDCNGDTDEPC
jgi:hypothetical protein